MSQITAIGGRETLEPGLYFVATPIGAARDITLRALDILRDADVIASGQGRGGTVVKGTPRVSPVMARLKGSGRVYQVTEQIAIPRKQWKALVNEQKRKAAGRWYSGAQVA